MKRIKLILAALFLALGLQIYAQEAVPRPNDTDQLQPYHQERQLRHQRQRAPRAEARRNGIRSKKLRRAKRMRQAHRRQMRSLEGVARADGRVTPGERRAIKRHNKRFRKGAKRQLRRKHMRRTNRGLRGSAVPRGRS